MSKTKSVVARRRVSLFATSSLVAASLLAGAGLATVAVTPAFAANECGDPTGPADDVFACPAVNPTGIDYTTTDGDLVLVFVDDTDVGPTGNAGIRVTGAAGDSIGIRAINVVDGTGDLTVTSTAQGIYLTSPDSDIVVDLSDEDAGDGGPTITGSPHSIRIETAGAGAAELTMTEGALTGAVRVWAGSGGAAVDLGNATITGGHGVGVRASGDVTINVAGDVNTGLTGVTGTGQGTASVSITTGQVTSGAEAITARTVSGALTVETTGAVSGSTGIEARALGGDIEITTGAAVTGTTSHGLRIGMRAGQTTVDTTAGLVTGGDDGINFTIVTGGSEVGAANITTGAISAVNEGIDATPIDGDIEITVEGAITSGGHGVSVATSGIGDITVNANANITSTNGDALNLSASGGDIVASNTGVLSGDPGVVLANTGAGNITYDVNNNVSGTDGGLIATAESGTVTINVNNAGTVLDGTNGGAGAYGLSATVTDGDIVITSQADTSINGDTTGVVATATTGDGTVDIDLDGAVTAGGIGISASATSTGTINVETSGGVNAGGDGVQVRHNGGAAGVGSVTIVASDVTSTGGDGIDASSNHGATIAITASDIIGSARGVEALSTNGNLTVSVDGFITGQGSDGIRARSTGAGSVTVEATGATSGLISGADDGIEATATGAAGVSVNLVHADAHVLATDDGIIATTSGSGAVTVFTNASVTSGDDGIVAGHTGLFGANSNTISVTANGLIDAGGTGIDVDTRLGSSSAVVVSATGGILAGDVGVDVTSLNTSSVSVTTTGSVVASGGDAVTVTAGGATTINVEDAQGSDDGIQFTSIGGSLTVVATGTVTGQGDDGIAALTAGGADITANNVNGADTGINLAVGGAATVDVSGTITGTAGDGVNIIAGGDVDATTNVTSGGDEGISIATTGSVLLDANGATTGTNGDGIVVTAGGTANVTTEAVSGGDRGIAIDSDGNATVLANGDVTGVLGDGIQVISGGAIDIDAGNVTSGNGDGVYAEANGAGAGLIDISITGAVDAADNGIFATTDGDGGITIATGALSTMDAGDNGIHAFTSGAAGAITITADGSIGESTDLIGGTGIYAEIDNTANANAISVTATNGIFAEGYGINVLHSGLGDVTVGAAGITTLNNHGISVTIDNAASTGAINIDANGAIAAGDKGIRAVTAGLGLIDIDTFSTIASAGIGVQARIDEATSTAAIDVNIGGAVLSTGDVGVYAENNGTGNTTVITTASVGGTTGIQAESQAGTVTVNAGATVTGTTGEGVRAVSFGGGAVDVDVVDVNSGDSDGVYAESLGGAGLVSVTVTGAVDAGDNGVFATTDGTGGISVVTGSASTMDVGDDGIHAISSGSAGGIDIDANGSIGSDTDFIGGTGIYAELSGTGNADAIVVDASGDIFAEGYGVNVLHSGTGAVTVDAGNVTTTNNHGVSVTIDNAASTGAINIDANGEIDSGDKGVRAVTNGLGLIDIDTFDTITSAGIGVQARIDGATSTAGVSVSIGGDIDAGDEGVYAENNGLGTTTVTSNSDISGSIGIVAEAAGAVSVSITGSGDITGTTGAGITATSSGSSSSVSLGLGSDLDAAGDGIIVVAAGGGAGSATTGLGSDVDADGTGISVTVTGGGSATVTTGLLGSVSAGDDGIVASSTGGAGNVTVTTGLGNDITAGLSGIVASNAGTGNVTVTTGIGADIDANIAGISASATGGGNATVNIGALSSIDPDDYGVYDYSALGDATVTSGIGASVTVDDSIIAGQDFINVGIYAESGRAADAGAGDPSVEVDLGLLNTITVTPGSETDLNGALGIFATNTGGGTGSVSITAGAGLSVSVTSDIAAGVLAMGSGDVTVTTGTGTVTVTAIDGDATDLTVANDITGGVLALDPLDLDDDAISIGIGAASAGGNVVIDTDANVTVTAVGTAIDTTGVGGGTEGTGTVDITTGGAVVSGNGAGVLGFAEAGDITIVTSGTVTSTNGAAVDGETTTGAIFITANAALNATNADGILATTEGGSVTIETNAGATISGNATSGIRADVQGVGGAGSISVTVGADIGTSGNRVDLLGVYAYIDNNPTNTGTVSVGVESGVDVWAGAGTGILAITEGAGTGVLNAAGVVVNTAVGSSVHSASTGFIGAGGIVAAISNTANNNAVSVNALGDVESTGANSPAIAASTTGLGSATASSGVGTTVSSAGGGVLAIIDNASNAQLASATANGAVNVALNGVFANNTNGTGGATALLSSTGSIAGTATNGVVATAGGSAGAVSATNNGTIGSSGDAVTTNGVSATITNALNGSAVSGSSTNAIFAGSRGLLVTTVGGGSATATNSGTVTTTTATTSRAIDVSATTGVLQVTSSGALTSAGAGIVTNGTTGATTISTTGSSSGITAAGDGVNATTTTGSISVTNASAISGVRGVVASGGGAITVQANAGVSGSTGPAIQAATTGASGNLIVNVAGGNATTSSGNSAILASVGGGNATITVSSTRTVSGVGGAAGVIDVTKSTAGTVAINNSGTIRSNDNTATGYDDLAINGVSGANVTNYTIQNDGLLAGRVTIATAGVVQLTNTSGDSWHFTGASSFGSGADVLNNTSTGLIATNAGGAATSLDFGAGADTFTQAGKLAAGEPGEGAATLTITNLEAWNNSGLILFGSNAGYTTSDGFINDRIISAGTAFTASGSSRLAMDADLGAITQGGCATLTAADCFGLVGGATDGTTEITVNDVSANAFGSYNPGGIVLVDVNGGTSAAGDFVLDDASDHWRADAASADGVLDKGLFFYDLDYDAANEQHVLVGLPDHEVFEMPVLALAAQTTWYTTTGTWFDRQADLRNTIGGLDEGATGGAWLRITGNWSNRDLYASFDSLGTTYEYNVSHDQRTVALVGGVDLVNVAGENRAFVAGITGGYVDSDIRFTESDTRVRFEGTSLGVYGTYATGAFFLDAIVNANYLDVDYDSPNVGLPVGSTVDERVDSLGGQLEGGFRIPVNEGAAFVEPLFTLSYVNTDFGDLMFPGATMNYDEIKSFRGALGLRVSGDAALDTYTVKFGATGRVWEEFEGENLTIVDTAGPDLPLVDDFGGTLADIGVDLSLFSAGSRLGVFSKVAVKFKEDYESTDATIGFRYTW